MICEFGDVVVVPFPFVDRPIVKSRPALAFSSQEFNADNGQTVLAMITTASKSSWPTDVGITDGDAAGIRHPSVVRWKLFTLPNRMIMRSVGRLCADDRAAVTAIARQCFAP